MPSIPVHIALGPNSTQTTTNENPLPTLLHTPTGLALLEIQGTVHFPPPPANGPASTQIGKLVFPLYNPSINDPEDIKWMKRVYIYVGKGQRMTGECKKLAKPIGVMRKRVVAARERLGEDVEMGEGNDEGVGAGNREAEEELEIVEVVRYKIVFSARPEPVSGVVEA
ncbi:hypothetical protein IAQ61_009024 [Plenodomus lingam]|uniref:uncharacterized protein n=1 Tax=Leptosphaeria maculans TaxID=5022 RepID=UPI00331934DA|nr:hypothetical protein IAQ61_009024 [Plenodomus lingam]